MKGRDLLRLKAKAWALVEEWNQKYPVGTPVVVIRDNGEKFSTRTRGKAELSGAVSPVVRVEGISGCYHLGRITPAL
jgi:hypothetical protein